MANVYKFPMPRLGVGLRSEETELPAGAVRRADNVDIYSSGKFARRPGYTVLAAGAGFHSSFATLRGSIVVQGSEAFVFNAEDNSLTLACDLGSSNLVDFAEANKDLFFGNEASLWWIPGNATTARRVGVSLPAVMPAITAGSGELLAGKYAVAVSRVDARGEESRTELLGHLALSDGGGVQLSGMVADASSTYRVYLTTPDGDVLYLSEEFSGAFTTFVVTKRPDGKNRATQHLVPMKPGTFVESHGGRIYTAVGDTLNFSQPLRFGLYDPRYDFIQFSGKIRVVAPVDEGLYVGDDRGVWFLPGKDPSDARLKKVSGSLAVFRSGLVLPGANISKDILNSDSPVAVWLSTEGYMVGNSSGEVTPLNPEKLRVAADLEGRSRFVVREGLKQVITLLSAAGQLGYGLAIDTLQ